jgi:hypothetical protein
MLYINSVNPIRYAPHRSTPDLLGLTSLQLFEDHSFPNQKTRSRENSNLIARPPTALLIFKYPPCSTTSSGHIAPKKSAHHKHRIKPATQDQTLPRDKSEIRKKKANPSQTCI